MADAGTAVPLVVAGGVAAQWVASRLRVPAIILLLAAGLLAGPVLGWLDPDELLGDLLFPGVSMGVALLLFEGGLSLRWRDLGTARMPLLRLLTVGAALTLVLAAGLTDAVTDLPTGVAVLFGSIMVVTGPTVVIPLIAEAHLRHRLARLLRWEGIFIDPIGAVLGVTVLEVLLQQDADPGGGLLEVAALTLATSAWGSAVGVVAGVGLTFVLGRHWVPDHHVNAVSLAVVLAAWAGANAVFHESGLYTATIIGVVLANQRSVPIKAIHELQRQVAPLVLGVVFILLAARVDPDSLRRMAGPAALVTAGLVLVVRPLAVAASTIGTVLTTRERAYAAMLAPRGIVAASVSALFGLRLEEEGIPGGDRLASLTFLVVAATVVVYGLAARPLARRLRVARPDPKGVAVVGAAPWAAELAAAIADADVPVLVITSSEQEAAEARARHLLVYDDRLSGEELIDALQGVGVRMAIAVSGSEELSEFVVDRLVPELGQANVYRLARDDDERAAAAQQEARQGRLPFGGAITQADVAEAVAEGATFAVLTSEAGEPESIDVLPLLGVRTDGTPEVLNSFAPDGRHPRVVALVSSPSR